MNSQLNSGKKVYVVLSRTHAKIWKNEFDPGSEPIIISGPHMGHEKKKLVEQFLNGRFKGGFNPKLGAEIAHELHGFDEIYLAGGGKGKANAVLNFTTFLRSHNRELAERIRRVQDINAESMSEGELLAVAREMITHI
jgi:hypothetical protein